MKKLEEILKRCEAATPGPLDGKWAPNGGLPGEVLNWPIARNDLVRGYPDTPMNGLIATVYLKENQEFFAHARTDLPCVTKALQLALEALKKLHNKSYIFAHSHPDSLNKRDYEKLREVDNFALNALVEIEKIMGEKKGF